MVEKELQNRIVAILKQNGWTVNRSPAFVAGEPDIKADKGGTVIYIEVKDGVKKVGFQQAIKISKYKLQGYQAEFVFSWEDFINKFGSIITSEAL